MILNIDLSGKDFICTQAPRPKLDNEGTQRIDKETQLPLWSTQCVVTDPSGGEIISITTAGTKPDVDTGEQMQVTGLTVFIWKTKDRIGSSYRAEDIKVID